MTSFAGLVGQVDGVWLWTSVNVVKDENGDIVYWTTQFGQAFPNAGDDVEISGYAVTLSTLTYDWFSDEIAGAGKLTIDASGSLNQTAGGFVITGGADIAGSWNIVGTADVSGSIENDGLITLSNYLFANPVSGSFYLTGSGDLRMRDGAITGYGGDSSITDFYNESTISGNGLIGAEFGYAHYPSNGGYVVFHNAADGVVDANVSGETLLFHTGMGPNNPIDNKGVMRASNGGILEITGSYPYPGVSGHMGVWVEQSSSGRIEALTGSTVILNNAVVTGGTLHGEGSGVIRSGGFQTQLIDLKLTETTVFDVGRRTVLKGDIDNAGEMQLTDGLGGLAIDASGVDLTGGGEIVLIGGYYDPSISGKEEGAVLTNEDNTLRGVGTIGGANLAVINGGTISADDTDGHDTSYQLTLTQMVSLVNTGTLQAVSGGKLKIENPLSGSISNIGGTIRADGAGSIVEISAVIKGGLIETENDGKILATDATFDGSVNTVTFDGDITISYSSALYTKGDIVNKDTIALYSRNAIGIAADTEFSGGGTITMTDGFERSYIVASTNGAKLTNVDNTISGAGLIGKVYYYGTQNGLQFVNGALGTIIANISGKELEIDTGTTFTNNGIVRADNGGILDIDDKMVGTGSLEITGGSTLHVSDDTDFDVTFVGTSHDNLDLRGNGSDPIYDFDVIGMGAGDRILLSSYGSDSNLSVRFEYTDTGARIQAFLYSAQSPWINLAGATSEGQFEIFDTVDGRYIERVVTRDGTSGNNTLTADAAGERIIGLDGNDILISGAGNDVLDGSRGADTADYRNATSGVTVNLGLSTAQLVGGGNGTDRLLGIENLTGSAFGDTLTGNSANNVINGGAGADFLRGGGGEDTLTGGAAGDTFVVSGYGSSTSTITDFVRGTDKIGTEEVAAIQTVADIAALVQDTSNTQNATLTFSNGQTLILTGVDWRTLTVSDFVRVNNTAPSISGLYTNTIEENSAISTVAATVYGWDAQNDRLTYSLSGDDAKFFTIDTDGNVRFKASPNFEAKADKNHDNIYTATVKISDGALSDTRSFSVEVTDDDEKPIISGPAQLSLSVAEGTSTSFYKVNAADPEGKTLTYSFGNIEGIFFFDIDSSGNVSFKTPPDFANPDDLNYDGVYNINVVVSDGYEYAVQALEITIADVNRAPVITTNGGGATALRIIDENWTYPVAFAGATDGDAGDTLVWSISGGADKAKFKINSHTGVLEFLSAPDFEKPTDANKDNKYEVIIKVSDGKSSDTQTLTVRVDNLNEAPVITSNGGKVTAQVSIKENVTAVTKVLATDVDAGSKLTYSIIDGSDKAKFAIDKVTGALKFLAAPDFEKPGDANKDNVYDVKVQVSDGARTDTQTLAVKIVNDNDAPTITSNGGGSAATISVKENTKSVTKVSAKDADAGSKLTYSIINGSDKAKFTIDKATGVLSFVTAPDFEKPGDSNKDNSYNVKVQVSDGSKTDTQTLTINVSDVLGITKSGTGKDETLKGTSEQDVLNGKEGKDLLIGGAAADTFVFDTKLGSANIDTIDDFNVLEDRIRLDDDIFTKIGKVGELAASAFVISSKAQDGSDRIVYDKTSGKLWYDADGNGKGAAIQFALLDKNLALTASDFVIVA